jgi:hypothetical protein
MHILFGTVRLLVVTAFAAFLGGCGGNSSASAAPPVGFSSSRVSPDNTGNHPAEIFNQILPYPCSSSVPCPTDFEVTFRGNVTSDIPSNEPINIHENAFCPEPSGSTSCAPTVTYNPSSNTTTVEYSGSTLYQNRFSGAPGVHFGMLAGQNKKTNIKSLEAASYWTYPSSPAAPEPIVSVSSNEPAKSSGWKYAVVYVAGSISRNGGSTYATWNEIAYVPKGSKQPQLTFTNYGTQTIYVASSGIVLGQSVPTDKECLKNPACPENLTLLGNLQEVNFPPPGASGSPFVALQHPPRTLKPHK